MKIFAKVKRTEQKIFDETTRERAKRRHITTHTFMSWQNPDFKIPVAKNLADNNLPLRGFTIVVATCGPNFMIGRNGDLPWSAPEDLKHFAEVTKTTTGPSATSKVNAVVMGRKTYESIPAQVRPLAGRLNVVVTTSETWNLPAEDLAAKQKKAAASAANSKDVSQDSGAAAAAASSAAPVEKSKTDVLVIRGDGGLQSVLALLSNNPTYADVVQRVFVIGGSSLFTAASEQPCVRVLQNILITRIDPSLLKPVAEGGADGDSVVCFPALDKFGDLAEDCEPRALDADSAAKKQMLHSFVPRNNEEAQYLNLIRTCITSGITKEDRTGVGTVGVFGAQMRFSLRDGRIPLLTTKRVFWKGVCEELIWFLRAETDSKLLESKGVNIWKGNGSRDFLDSRGLKSYEEGELGPVYGFQWRHFGAEYEGKNSNYDGKGVDQVKRIVETLKTNPNDRRLLLSAWNPCAIDKMALPPCHVMAQFFADTGRNELSCMLFQRSCDMGLGVPFNIASYSLLTLLICRATGFKPGEFIHTLGDAHVYKNHVEPLKEQLARVPRAFPFIRVVKDRQFLEDYEISDFEICDYAPYPTIQMEMAV